MAGYLSDRKILSAINYIGSIPRVNGHPLLKLVSDAIFLVGGTGIEPATLGL